MTDVILITGGAGFLAQHLIRELQEHWHGKVKEIRVVDKRLFQNYLKFDEKIPIKEYIVDCAKEDELGPTLEGATMVFNLASRQHTLDMYQDSQRSYTDNFTTVEVLTEQMQRYHVPWLVHVSDAVVCVGSFDAQGSTEVGTLDAPPGGWLYGPYAETKFKGEMVARNANGASLSGAGKEQRLHTAVVRPTLLYGEGERWVIPHCVELCKIYGCLVKIVQSDACMQLTYAGNAARLLMRCAEKLVEQPDVMGGEVFFCTEYTLPVNFYDYVTPFVEAAGYHVTKWSVPYELYMVGNWFVEKFFGFFSLFNVRYPHKLPDNAIVKTIASWYFHYSGQKQRLLLDWQPPYQPEQALQKTLDYFKSTT